MLPALLPCFMNQPLDQTCDAYAALRCLPPFLIPVSVVLRFKTHWEHGLHSLGINHSLSCLTLRIGKATKTTCFKGATLLLGLFLLLVLKLCVHVYV